MSKKKTKKGFVVSRTPAAMTGILRDLRGLIAEARQDVARQVNSTLALLHWRIGKRILRDILEEKRADYGKKIVSSLRRQLGREFGQGFGDKNL